MVALNLYVLPRIVLYGEGGKWNGVEGRVCGKHAYLHLVAIDCMALPFLCKITSIIQRYAG